MLFLTLRRAIRRRATIWACDGCALGECVFDNLGVSAVELSPPLAFEAISFFQHPSLSHKLADSEFAESLVSRAQK